VPAYPGCPGKRPLNGCSSSSSSSSTHFEKFNTIIVNISLALPCVNYAVLLHLSFVCNVTEREATSAIVFCRLLAATIATTTTTAVLRYLHRTTYVS